jgi:rhamnose utilization protein RhaD (predicted bifunctional aldolase and dehydrogenase)
MGQLLSGGSSMGGIGELVELSRRYGGDPDWVLAGGGNSSWKDGSVLHVKASGCPMAGIGPEGFCAMDRKKLDAMWAAEYPKDPQAREAEALKSLMSARLPGEEKRPSVETLMHALFPEAFVMHTHPAAVNGMTCGRGGREAFLRLFGKEAIWVPFVDPGYVLALAVRAAYGAFASERGFAPRIMFMQNHGLLVSGESAAEVVETSDRVMSAIAALLERRPDPSAADVDPGLVARAASCLAGLAAPGSALLFRADAHILRLVASRDSFSAIGSAFTPDHIVYAGHEYLYAEEGAIEAAWKEYEERNGCPPKICCVRGLGAFSVGKSAKAARISLELFADSCKVAAYSENFGGPRHMRKENIDFIRNWEVERFRSSVSAGA